MSQNRSMWIDFLILIGILPVSKPEKHREEIVPGYHFFRLDSLAERQADLRGARKMEEIYKAI